MIEGVNILEFGLFGGAFAFLLWFFVKFVTKVIENSRIDAKEQREGFFLALHEITNEVRSVGKEVAIVNIKLDEHIRGGSDGK